jgi:rare lipoprotein A
VVVAPPAPVPAPAPGPAPAPTPAPPVGQAPSGPGNPPFYEVFGERYYVLPSGEGYRTRGVASWYGKEFHGRRTSSGVVYDMYAMTAAHKTLPLPSLARVTNVANGRSVVVTVNDRGPFAKGRVIDLSYAAARELDIIQSGTAEVDVEVVAAAPAGAVAAAPANLAARQIWLQVGAFHDRSNAERLRDRLVRGGVSDAVIRYDEAVDPALYRVRVGPLSGPAEYDAVASRVRALDLPAPRLVTESPARP